MTYQKILHSKDFLSLPKQFQQMFCNQPFYKSPKNYYDWDQHLSACFTAYANSLTQNPTWLDKYSKTVTVAERKSFQSFIADFLEIYFLNKTPALYLQRNLVEAIFNTKLPLIPADLQIPFNSIVLMLPKDMPEIYGTTIKRIILLYGKNNKFDNFYLTDPADSYDENFVCRCLVVLSNGAATFVSGSANSNGQFKINYRKNTSVFSDKLISKITEVVFKFALNAILLSQYQPELLTTDPCTVLSGTGFNNWRPSKNKILPIRWLGKNYKRSTESCPGNGNHASPQAHWRRGHWHHFRYGKKRKLLKLKWIQPVFVNAVL